MAIDFATQYPLHHYNTVYQGETVVVELYYDSEGHYLLVVSRGLSVQSSPFTDKVAASNEFKRTVDQYIV